MALPLTGSDLICLAAPSESQCRELYLMSLTCGIVFLKVHALAHFSLQFMQARSSMSWKSTSQLFIIIAKDSQLNISSHSAQADAVASIEDCIQDIRQWNRTSFDQHQTATC